MFDPNYSPNWTGFIAAMCVCVLSAAMSVVRRIVNSEGSGWLWAVSEFLIAILCGYLAWTAHPHLPFLPSWVTPPILVAFCAHSGGRIFQELESTILAQASTLLRPK